MTPLERLGSHVANDARDWPAPVLDGARLAFLDTVGCMLAGSSSGPALHAASVAALMSPGTIASPVEGGAPVSPTGYAFVAGTAAHALDYDDVFEPALSHPSAVLVPAILAASTIAPVTGQDLLDAYIIGIDAQAFIAEAVNYAHYESGWHSTSTIGAPSAAAGVARLLRLDAPGVVASVSLAISMAAGSKRQFGTDAKPLHAGMAAQAGVVAAFLGKSGASASSAMLDGKWSFRELYSGTDGPGFDGLLEDGADCALSRHGIWAKPYPCCASTHRPIDALLALLEDQQFTANEVHEIHARVSPVAAANLMYETPVTPAQARFSMNHCLAAALAHGKVAPASFTPAMVASTEIERLRHRVRMTAEPAFSVRAGPDGRAERAEVIVTLNDGSTHALTVGDPLGHPRNPMAASAYRRKFLDCTESIFPSAYVEETMTVLQQLGAAPFMLSAIARPSTPSPKP